MERNDHKEEIVQKMSYQNYLRKLYTYILLLLHRGSW